LLQKLATPKVGTLQLTPHCHMQFLKFLSKDRSRKNERSCGWPMKFSVVDCETFYSDTYTLKKMTTEAYVRDPRFKLHCAAVKVMDSLPPMGENPIINTTVLNHEALKIACVDVQNYGMVCHKASFDGLILNHHYDARPAFWFDTLSMARLVFPHEKSHSLGSLAAKFGLPPKIVPYNEFRGVRDLSPELYSKLAAGCAHDVELTYLVFRALLPLVPREELRVIDMTIRMFTEPTLQLDYKQMEDYHEQVKKDKEQILSDLGVAKEDLQSSAKFAGLLQSLGVVPPTKPSSKDPNKIIYAFAKTDEEMKELCDDEDPRVSALCSARLGQKSTLNETRCARLLGMAERGSLTVPLRYYGAGATGRFSGEDQVNFQNFPRSGEIRRCIIAPRGYVILVGDLSQIECRKLNWLAGEEWVLQAFREGRDLYSEGATQFYKRIITKADKAERGMAKQVELSCGFGSGGPKIALTARRGTYGPPVYISDAEGTQWRDFYRQKHPKVVTLWSTGASIMNNLFNGTQTDWRCMKIRDKKVYLPNGAWLDYSNLVYKGAGKYGRPDFAVARRQGESRIYGSKFIQNIVEALSRLILTRAMVEMQRFYHARLCTHDEGVWLVPEAEADQAAKYLRQLLTTPPDWCQDVPLEAEVSYDTRYTK
jgi:hypothetical protein